jgi:hypothetical protein
MDSFDWPGFHEASGSAACAIVAGAAAPSKSPASISDLIIVGIICILLRLHRRRGWGSRKTVRKMHSAGCEFTLAANTDNDQKGNAGEIPAFPL